MSPAADPKAQAQTQPKLVWNDEKMRSQYSNVTNVVGGREEIILLFGLSQAWKPGQKEIPVELSDRMVLSPFAAKRLAILLTGALKAYEQSFGTIDLSGAPVSGAKG